ncbi:HDOD domain-containing protein [methane-oxidizing endosymbiont of Gigantopelta aegis]|uniref:HDOD domain-containing protein n=1 Tax=methane-oxidizing endosymbiont of Gigantopelta aegis TaxID=2794938 RepID=UPI0018DBB55A|nr:HDOD domain-containing protein [methane-oxidizing endosymbiont of Gigantopelta aegis]
MTTNSDHQSLVIAIKNLPPLSKNNIRIINTVNNPDVDVDELVAVLSSCPVLVARLLGLANSSYFGRTTPITDLKVAIIQVLGFNLVKSLALSIALNIEFDTKACPEFDAEFYWNFILTQAFLAQKLASKHSDESLSATRVYSTALMTEIGILAAVFVWPKEMNAVFSTCEKNLDCINEHINLRFGMNYYELGYLLLRRWHLPEIYSRPLKALASNSRDAEDAMLVLLLRLGRKLTQQLFAGEIDDLTLYSQELNRFSWTEQSFSEVLQDLEMRKAEIQELAAIITG